MRTVSENDGYRLPKPYDGEITADFIAEKQETKKTADKILERIRANHLNDEDTGAPLSSTPN